MLLCACSTWAQDATVPPASQHAVLTVQGKGVQIYTCKARQWVFVAPAARLFDASGIEIGSHGDGPIWMLQDGSAVIGKLVAKNPSPDAGAVPWLLLKASSTGGKGTLAGVEMIRRSETKGGAAPGGSCDEGALVRVLYEAAYTFYSSK